MRIVWASDAWDDYLYWQSADPKVLRLINDLINDTRRSPFRGLGKPEPLKYDLKGWWSRRITSDHRLVYRVSGSGSLQQLEILQCRYHYR
jgi:toxin YoeB